MTKEQEALKLALELKLALKALEEYHYGEARIIIHEALAQPPLPAQEQRPWTGLTDEERRTVLFKSDTAEEVAIGIETKLKEKNYG